MYLYNRNIKQHLKIKKMETVAQFTIFYGINILILIGVIILGISLLRSEKKQ